ncbi:hypothetical protein ETD86_15140 [Nonomuraea turkmeniaca]|uniref:Uncharacterized protein n=1 Tax=Nonomuraea turkmeniaca TaxID=103838 RepID=A0A5S4FLA3_9ACTN|nr:hypothetical protein [Nonomuraea turkmeniaca]TMR21506.1 hypothetical protein ETD86_15140 [Nonomuraea turkmeniaca]
MGDFTLRLQVTDGALTVGIGPRTPPLDLIIERLAGHPIRELMSGSKTPNEVLHEGSLRVEGAPALPESSAVLRPSVHAGGEADQPA